MAGNRFCELKTSFHLSEQQNTTISGYVASVEIGLDLTALQAHCSSNAGGKRFFAQSSREMVGKLGAA